MAKYSAHDKVPLTRYRLGRLKPDRRVFRVASAGLSRLELSCCRGYIRRVLLGGALAIVLEDPSVTRSIALPRHLEQPAR